MNWLRWPAPAPWPRTSAAPMGPSARFVRAGVRVSDASAGYTSAVVAPASSATFSSLGLFEGVTNFCVRLQFAVHRERAEPRGQRPRQHAIDVAGDDAGQRHAAALDDDVDWRVRHDRVVPEVRVAVDGPRDPIAQLVVELRYRQRFNPVAHFA